MSVPILGEKRGYFIAFDGMDGTGKTTQVDLLKKALELTGFSVKVVRAPGGSEISERIRSIVKDKKYTKMSYETELLLMSAAMGQSAVECIKPALDAGSVVIADRYHYSTLCFQTARGLDQYFIRAVMQFSLKDILPDVTFLLTADDDCRNERLQVRGSTDRFEQESEEYLQKVRDNYRQLQNMQAESNGKLVSVNSSGPVEQVHNEIYRCAAHRIGQLREGALTVDEGKRIIV